MCIDVPYGIPTTPLLSGPPTSSPPHLNTPASSPNLPGEANSNCTAQTQQFPQASLSLPEVWDHLWWEEAHVMLCLPRQAHYHSAHINEPADFVRTVRLTLCTSALRLQQPFGLCANGQASLGKEASLSATVKNWILLLAYLSLAPFTRSCSTEVFQGGRLSIFT